SPREVQREVFRRQIGLAIYFGKPIIIHCRDAFIDVIDIMIEEGAGEVGGIFHAFSGGVDEALRVLELGFLVGVGGPLTYKNSKLPEVVSRLPSSSIVLETDCPYLPPVPYRGKRNEPAYVRIVAEKLAEVLGVSFEDVERATEVNYRRLLHGEQGYPTSIAYGLKGNIYINVTGTCTNNCTFCPRHRSNNFLYGHNLNLISDPSVDEMVSAVRDLNGNKRFGEIVFCGYGEPTSRASDIVKTANQLRNLRLPFRLNTNGQGNMINQRNIVPELGGVFDKVSVSLNAPDRDTYLRVCRPDAGERAFDAVLDFLRKASSSGIECEATVLDYPGIDMNACRALVDSIPQARFRLKRYHFTACEG
ncbi:MAG: TatD family nuclease-associated radical SAM protein, partial [Candidatus Krumholzibacteria bacterium]|nr:TatD family nuclease-associated radical SAM protein [Candidatus Krumholzibacteria bacterium]